MTSRWLFTGALALAACTEPRQIVLSIGTTAGVPCDLDSIRVVTKAAGTTTFEQRLKGTRIPVDVTLLDDTSAGRFELEISGFRGAVEVIRVNGVLQFSNRKDVQPVLLEPRCTPDARCSLTEAMAAGEELPRASGVSCADVTRYNAVPAIDSTLVDVCSAGGSGRVFKDTIEGPAQLADLESKLASSDFQFYGRPVRHVWVAKDGYISFTETDPDPHDNLVPGALDSTPPPPRQSVMAFWDTLSLNPEGVCYLLSGIPGNQQLRVQWAGSCLTTDCVAVGSDDLNFSIALEETSHRVVLTYGTMKAENGEGALGLNATAGLVNDPNGCAAKDCALETGLCRTDNTPCGYSQVFSKQKHPGPESDGKPGGVPSMQFTPVVEQD